MTYVVRIWCSVCTGVDFQGCNQGKAGYLMEKTGEVAQAPGPPKVFAENMGHAICDTSGDRWDFEVEVWSKYGTYLGWNEPVPDCEES